MQNMLILIRLKKFGFDYIIGIAFIAQIHFREGLLKSGRLYREFSDIKDFQDFMDDICS